jgi:prephenate dehydrogenase
LLKNDPVEIGIIGGHGAMGRFFTDVFTRAGHEVSCSGREGTPTNSHLARSCDLVMVSVPVRSTVGVIGEIAPLLAQDQVICDLTSLKQGPVEAMLRSKAQVVGLHPMFGPSVGTMKGQVIVATPARCEGDSLRALFSLFRDEGARITLTTPEAHDRMMAVVQGLTHFASLALAQAMRRLDTDIPGILDATSPIYRIEMDLIGRIHGQDPSLYADILQLNPFVPAVLTAFLNAAADLSDLVESGNAEALETYFKENERHLSGYIPRATAESDALIRRLVEL